MRFVSSQFILVLVLVLRFFQTFLMDTFNVPFDILPANMIITLAVPLKELGKIVPKIVLRSIIAEITDPPLPCSKLEPPGIAERCTSHLLQWESQLLVEIRIRSKRTHKLVSVEVFIVYPTTLLNELAKLCWKVECLRCIA
ncbi:hypothetical protein KCV03_g99, partial [Aureobasidium melanogenum]